ncbi:MAG: nicotinamide riboside transporter PnuC [Cyclobacteriaceae bacterium]|jgi:nicotinamide mononucleotide transporter|nr:nicotinamide riboside transporter PnuC [Cyclobacteriaceae bacterium]
MNFFDHQSVFFSLWGYNMSYLEFFGTFAGALAVWLSAKGKIISWPLGLINVTLFFFLFYQIQLYPDMFLQVFFFVTNILGWWRWSHPNKNEEDFKKELRVSFTSKKLLIIICLVGFIITFLFGLFASNLHVLLPKVFQQPSAFPFLDSFVTIMSIVATYLMVQKKVECWLIWLAVDIVATGLYFSKGIYFVGVEYFVFCIIAAFGFIRWRKEYLSYGK